MGTQSVVLVIGLVVALIGGLAAGMVEGGTRVAGWMAIGLVALTWTLVYLAERAAGRDMWHYTAAYPDLSNQRAGDQPGELVNSPSIAE